MSSLAWTEEKPTESGMARTRRCCEGSGVGRVRARLSLFLVRRSPSMSVSHSFCQNGAFAFVRLPNQFCTSVLACASETTLPGAAPLRLRSGLGCKHGRERPNLGGRGPPVIISILGGRS